MKSHEKHHEISMKSHENIIFATQIYNFAKMMVSWDFMLISWRFHRNNGVFLAISSRPFFPRTPAALIASVTAAEILTMWQVAWYSAEVVAKNVGYFYGNYHWYMVPSIDMVYGKYHI